MAPRRRYRLDQSVQRHGNVVIGGSPLTLFRVTDAGMAIVEQIAAGAGVPDSTLVTALTDAGAIHPVPMADDTPFSAADVTVVVPTLGTPGHAPDGAIVVDDGSEPPVQGATIRLGRNQGPGVARSAGLERVTTPLVAFVDGDVQLPDGWLDPLLPHFVDDRVALVAPRVCSRPGDSPLARYETAHSPLDLGTDPARIQPGSRVSYVPAAAIVCRADAIREIGGFDDSLRFGEDVDLVWRLVEAGWRCRYEPASEVHHEPRTTAASWIRQRIDYGSSAASLARRHPGALAPLRMNVWSLGAWLLGAAGRPVLGTAVGTGSAAALIGKLPDLPPATAFRLGMSGNLQAGGQIAAAVRRVWWPVVAIAALRSKAARRVLVASLVAARHPITIADDGAYSLGVWRGLFAERTIEPLIPEITAWPPRRTPTSSAPLRRRPGWRIRYRRTT